MGRPAGGVPKHLLHEYRDDRDPKTIRTLDKVVWWCAAGHTYVAALRHRLNGTGCGYCSGKNVLLGFNDLASTHPHLAKEWNDDVEWLKNVTAASNKKAKWRCDEGHEWVAEINSRNKGRGCPFCSGQRAEAGVSDLPTLAPEVMPLYDDDTDPSTLTKNSVRSVWWKCPLGHKWSQKVYVVTKGHRCPVCTGKVVREGFNDLATTRPDLVELWSPNNKMLINSVPKGTEKRALWLCGNGHEWEATIGNVAAGSRCPKCASPVSKAESEIYEMVRSWAPDAEQSNRKILEGKELDIYIPSKNIAIEYNGLYWHSEGLVGKNYHRDKWLACQEAGIQLITIWEDDWLNNKDVVKNMLHAKTMGRRNIGARKTTVIDVPVGQARIFMGNNHIQGWTSGTHYTGLEHEGELVALMITKVTNGVARLERYAATVGVSGGMDKMMKHLGYQSWITFADHCVSDGGLYANSGWVQNGELAPDYRYVYKGKRVHKFNFRLKRFKTDPNLLWHEGLSESELAALNEIPRIYDCGKTRYTKLLS